MRFSLIVTGPAYGTQQASTAYQFAIALLTANHKIINIFFYQEGVYNANSFTSPAVDEVDLVRAWQDLHKRYAISLHICASAALRRGIINKTEVGLSIKNLQNGFLFSSLGALTESALTCDRMIQF